MPTVSIVQRRLPRYRVSLFEELRSELGRHNIELRVLHGEPRSEEVLKRDRGFLPWAERLPTRYLAKEHLCWQPFAQQVIGDELVIMTHENNLLANHLALINRPTAKLAFWGHGANLQGESNSFRARFKNWTARRADWYFAYTQLSALLVQGIGFPNERITNLNNAVDLSDIKDAIGRAKSEGVDIRSRYGFERGPIGVYLGSLYPHKRLDFLLEAAQLIRASVPGFQLVVVGAGVEQTRIEAACSANPWIRYLGPLMGSKKAEILCVSDVILNPGLIGLGVLDAFISETPIVTTDCGLHSPEIAYLQSDNGIISPNDLQSYALDCVRLLKDQSLMIGLKAGCRKAAKQYTLENMVKNFSSGIQAVLDL